MPYTPKISIITAVYNGEKYLEDCIRSILGQTYPDLEYIIIDGGSTDRTTDIIKKYQDRLHYWVSEKDKGVYDAWNKGLAAATGEWIAFVGCDDILWNQQVLENAIAPLEKAKTSGIRYVYGKINLLSSGTRVISEWGTPWAEAKKDILQYMTVTHCCAFHHRSLFEEYGNFNDSFRITGDYEFLLREFSRGKDALFADQLFAAMHAGGLSANIRLKLRAAREHVRARRLNHLPANIRDRILLTKAWTANLLARTIGVSALNKISDFYRQLRGREKIWSRID